MAFGFFGRGTVTNASEILGHGVLAVLGVVVLILEPVRDVVIDIFSSLFCR